MNTHQMILVALDSMGGEVEGKTLLQKRLYMIGVLTSHDDALGYFPHYYGPYSAQVAEAVGQMRAVGFLSESHESYGGVDGRGFEIMRTDYRLTTEGGQAAALLRERYPDLADRIRSAWCSIQAAGNLDYVQLSVAAKVHYILREQGALLGPSEVARVAGSFGWSIADTDVAKAEEFLQRLGVTA